jgi:hypothetical protein
MSIESLVYDEETGEYLFPNQELVARVCNRLVANSLRGVGTIRLRDIGTILTEIDARLASPRMPERRQTGQERLLPAPTKEEEYPPRNASPPPPVSATPQLDDQQKAFLAFLSEHPDTPISSVYKGLGVSVWKGNELRDSLKAKGLLAEVALRTGKGGAGRPAKFVILTFQAYALFGIAPPHGRGGVLHRHVQAVIADGATAKGYTVTCEKALDNGAVVDVHLEKGQKKIAVEVAVFSTPEREIAHITHCLAVGYDQVITLFADETLLARTATALGEACSPQEQGWVRLLPFRELPHVG